MCTFFLAIWLGILLIYNIYIKKTPIIHPTILFCFTFWLNAVFYLVWIPKFPDIRINTALLVLLFCLLFSISAGVKIELKTTDKWKKNTCDSTRENRGFIHYICVSNYKTNIFLIFSIISFVAYYFAIRNIVLSAGVGLSSYSSIMAAYSAISKFTTKNVDIPVYVKLMKELVYAAGFVLGFIQINNFFVNGKKAVKPVIAFNIVISGLISLIIGSRSELVKLILAMVIMSFAYTIAYSTHKNQKKLTFKIVILFFLILISFKTLGNLLGRINTRTLLETLFMYIGGPLKNLDIAINEKNLYSELPGQLTFAYQYRNLANLLRDNNLMYNTSLPFTVLNDTDLGNVYTAFAVYLADFGILFSAALIVIMGFICGFLYRKFFISIINNSKPMWILVYSFLTYSILMEGFSEKFYGILFSANLYRHFIWFYLLIRFFMKNYKERL